MLTRYRLARGASFAILDSLAFALFDRKPPEIQKQLEQSQARLREFRKRSDRRHQSRPFAQLPENEAAEYSMAPAPGNEAHAPHDRR